MHGYIHRREEARTEPSTAAPCHFCTVKMHLGTLKNMYTRKKNIYIVIIIMLAERKAKKNEDAYQACGRISFIFQWPTKHELIKNMFYTLTFGYIARKSNKLFPLK